VDLVTLESPHRALVRPLLTYVNALEKQHPEGTSIVTVLLPEYIPAHFWEHFLHTQTALRLKAALLPRPHRRRKRPLSPRGLANQPAHGP
jgi:hypothetical protein